MIKNVALNDIVLELDLKNREYAREDGPVDPMHNAKKNLHERVARLSGVEGGIVRNARN